MPKYYCDYCDTFLTHDSASVRKSHIEGVRHQAAVKAYYAQLDSEYQEAPDRETMRYEKMKDDAMQFMMLGPPMMPPMMGMGGPGFPPMMPPPNFGGGYPPYGPPSGGAPRYDNRGHNEGWNDRRGPIRTDGRGPRGDDGYDRSSNQSEDGRGYRRDDRNQSTSENRYDSRGDGRGYGKSEYSEESRGGPSYGSGSSGGSGPQAGSSQSWH